MMKTLPTFSRTTFKLVLYRKTALKIYYKVSVSKFFLSLNSKQISNLR